MNKCRLSKYQMKTMPVEQISNRSQTYPKIRPNTFVDGLIDYDEKVASSKKRIQSIYL